MKKIERPGPVNVGEFSPLNTPERPGEVVTTAKDTAQNHRQKPDTSGSTGSMTKEWVPNAAPVRK